jgi:hypothetical protein
MNEKEVPSLNLVSRILLITRYQALLYKPSTGEQREIKDQELGKMATQTLIDLIMALMPPPHGCHP